MKWNNIQGLMEKTIECHFVPPIVLDTINPINDENLRVYKLYSSLYADTNIGNVYLPNCVDDEDDIYTIEDVLRDILSFQ